MDRKCGFDKKKCIGENCAFWIHLIGKSPQSNENIDKFDCALVFLPLLIVENAQMSRQTSAAVESLRNEIVKPTGIMGAIASGLDRLASAAHMKLIEENGGVDGLPPN